MSRLTGQTASPSIPEDGSIVAAQLSADSVTTSAILDNSITSAKILDGSILNSDLAPNCVNSSKIQDGTITGTDIAINTITGDNLAPGTITFNEIANNTVLGSKLQDGGITNAKMGVNSVGSSNIIDGTIQGADIAAGTITLANLAPIPNLSLVGLGVGGSPASPVAITLGSGLSFAGNILNTSSTLGATIYSRKTSVQTVVANTNLPVIFDSPTSVTTGTGLTLAAGTGVFTIPRVGRYMINCNMSIQSATANARGIFSLVPITAVLAGGVVPVKAFKLLAANINVEHSWTFLIDVTTIGTVSLNILGAVAIPINTSNNVPATAATTDIKITEIL